MRRNLPIPLSLMVCLAAGLLLLHPIHAAAEVLSGTVRLVPREGLAPGHAGGGPYGDPRLRDVVFVDYDHPGFAVIYLDTGVAPRGTVRMSIEASRTAVRFSPAAGALGIGGEILILNEDRTPHVVSIPALGLLRALAPKETLTLSTDTAGEVRLFLLDESRAEAVIFAAPGPYAVSSPDGKWRIENAPTGRAGLHAWHPRFPETTREVEIRSGTNQSFDLEIGVVSLASEADVEGIP